MNRSNNKLLLISINSINEATGGGLYLRALHNVLLTRSESVKVLGKSSNLGGQVLNKSFSADFFSRLFLCPCFLMIYFFQLLEECRQVDEIHFHSSRTLPIAFLIKLITRKEVHVHFDNVECFLSLKNINSVREAPLRLVDFFLLYIYELWLLRLFRLKITFITRADAKRLKSEFSEIIPVKVPSEFKCFPSQLFYSRRASAKRVLFVASFTHQPNVKAFYDLVEVAKRNLDFSFVVVGRDADTLSNYPNNVRIKSNLSYRDLTLEYKRATLFLCLVSEGGGMKTKVAEAMAYNLPILCNPHSLIGYEEVITCKLIGISRKNSELDEKLREFSSFYRDEDLKMFKEYWGLYEKYYFISSKNNKI